MFKSIHAQLIVTYLLVALLAMSVAAALAWSALDRAFLDVMRENMLAQARRVAQTIQAAGLGESYESEQSPPVPYSQATNVFPGFHTRVIDDEGVVILEMDTPDLPIEDIVEENGVFYRERRETLSDFNDELKSNLGIVSQYSRGRAASSASLIDRSEIQSAMAGEAATAVRDSPDAPNRRILYAAYPIRAAEGNVVSVAYVASPLPRLALSLLPDYLGPQVVRGAIVAILLAGLTGIILARQLTRPLQRLTEASIALARGQSVPPIPLAPTGELRALGAAFNSMNTNLAAAHETLSEQARQRETILKSLADAVIAVDETGDIIMVNGTAQTLLDFAPESLREEIGWTLAHGEAHATEINARDRVFELLITPLRDSDGLVQGAVAVGHDVTAYRQLDRLRANFISDVSHELRTPLTAIKGFVETLQNGAADDPSVRARFLRTIEVETERLIRLSNDLLLLTRADVGQLNLHRRPLDLGALAKRAARQLAHQARQRRVAVETDTPPEPALVQADADRVLQVLVNLIDNGLKFTPAGGKVNIRVEKLDGQVTCTVADTGPGIPQEEMPHVFERFYRGDPSRARTDVSRKNESAWEQESGAGLGLAIAKALIEGHGGQIWVESTQEADAPGSRFIFTLPTPG
ncbi:MAG TPA: HAMP domain-containing protein [Chloroflexi bacterium]|nr:HAMP domain-containing protein [Chloroflexota bacterium]